MVEAYTVNARLNFVSNAPEMLRTLLADFERLDSLIGASTKTLSRFAGDARAISEVARSVKSMAEGLGKLGGSQAMGGLAGQIEHAEAALRGMAEAQALMAKSAREAAAAYREMVPPTGGRGPRPPVAPGGGAPYRRHGSGVAGHLIDAGIGATIAGDVGGNWLSDALKASFEVDHLLAQFRQNKGVGDADIAKIRAQAEALTRNVPGTQIAENLHTILDAFTVTGKIGEALDAAPGLARLGLVLRSLPGKGSGDPAFAAAQAVELLQRYYDPKTGQIDMREFTRNVEAETRVAVGTGGRVTPEQYRAYAKQSRVAGMTANDQFLFEDLPAVLIALGGSRAGTAHAAVYQQLLTGRMTKQAMVELQKLGILDKGATWKGGMVQDIKHHLPGYDLAAEDYVEWVRQYGFKALKDHGIDLKDRKAVALALSRIASRQTGLAGLAEVFLGMTGIDKEAEKIRATSNDPLSNIEKYDPLQKVREFAAATNEFQVELGKFLTGPAIESLKQMTVALRGMTDWAKANPNAGKAIAETAAGLVLLAKAIGAIGMTLLTVAPLLALARLISPGAAGAAGAAGGGAAVAGGAGGVGLLARLGAAATGPVGLAVGLAIAAYLGSEAEKKGASRVLEAQKNVVRRAADAYGQTPQDGFDVYGRPVGRGDGKPVPVFLTNPGDLVHGTAGGLARQMNRPLPGATGYSDFRINPGSGLGVTQ